MEPPAEALSGGPEPPCSQKGRKRSLVKTESELAFTDRQAKHNARVFKGEITDDQADDVHSRLFVGKTAGVSQSSHSHPVLRLQHREAQGQMFVLASPSL